MSQSRNQETIIRTLNSYRIEPRRSQFYKGLFAWFCDIRRKYFLEFRSLGDIVATSYNDFFSEISVRYPDISSLNVNFKTNNLSEKDRIIKLILVCSDLIPENKYLVFKYIEANENWIRRNTELNKVSKDINLFEIRFILCNLLIRNHLPQYIGLNTLFQKKDFNFTKELRMSTLLKDKLLVYNLHLKKFILEDLPKPKRKVRRKGYNDKHPRPKSSRGHSDEERRLRQQVKWIDLQEDLLKEEYQSHGLKKFDSLTELDQKPNFRFLQI